MHQFGLHKNLLCFIHVLKIFLFHQTVILCVRGRVYTLTCYLSELQKPAWDTDFISLKDSTIESRNTVKKKLRM